MKKIPNYATKFSAPGNRTPLKIMKKEYLTALSILIGAIIISISVYMGTTKKFREQLKACETYYKDRPKQMKKCLDMAKFGTLGK